MLDFPSTLFRGAFTLSAFSAPTFCACFGVEEDSTTQPVDAGVVCVLGPLTAPRQAPAWFPEVKAYKLQGYLALNDRFRCSF